MKYTIGKADGLKIFPIGTILFGDDNVATDTSDEFIKSYIENMAKTDVKKTHCITDPNGSFGIRETIVEPSDVEYISYFNRSMPAGYCIIEVVMPNIQQQRKTA